MNPLKDNNGKTVLHGFVEVISEFKSKPNKLWVDQERGFYNSPMKKWSDDNDIVM